MSTKNNTNTSTIALVRAILHKDSNGLAPAVVRVDGRPRCGARLEVVSQDPSGAWQWSELHLGLMTKSGKLDMSSFPRKDLTIHGYTRTAGKRQVIRTTVGLLPWQESNLVYAQGRIQRGAHAPPVAFEPHGLISIEERQLSRRHATTGKISQVNWLPQLIDGRDRKGKIVPGSMLAEVAVAMGQTIDATDAQLVEAGGGSVDEGLVPLCLVKEAVGEAVQIDLREFREWTAVEVSTLPGLLTLGEFQEREAEFLRKQDLKKNGLRQEAKAAPAAEEISSPAEAAEEVAAAAAAEEAQG